MDSSQVDESIHFGSNLRRDTESAAFSAHMMPSSRHDTAAAERKRLRDRVAQQNLRSKRTRYVQALEQQVKLCHELHGSQDREDLRKTIRELRAEDAILRERQNRLQALLRSCEDVLRQPDSVLLQETGCSQPPQPVDNLNSVTTTLPSRLPQPSTPPGSPEIQSPKTPQAHSVQTLTASPSANYRELACGRATEISNSANQSFWVQDDTFEAGNTPDASTAGLATNSYLTEVDDISKALVGDTFCATYSSTVRAEPPDLTEDVWRPISSTTNILSTSLPQTCPEFQEDFAAPSMPLLDLGPWSASGLWGTEKSIVDLPIWARVPLRNLTLSYHLRHCPWDSHVQAILDAPDTPSPLDLLFGSHHNPLANLVQSNVKKWYPGDPERLAIGWLAYHHIKWRTQPTFERFLRLPDCLKPTSEQMWLPHPGCLDMIFWKKLRLNILESYNKYDIDAFMRLYCRCLKLRWSRDEEVLVPGEEDGHVVRPDFLERFMSEGGWGLKDELIAEYPELFDGIDLQRVVYYEL